MGGTAGRWQWVRARVGAHRAVSGGVLALAALPVAALLASANGLPTSRAEMSAGTAWLASPSQGIVTLIDGASEQVVGAVRVPAFRPGDDLSVAQAGSSAYVVNPGEGTVSRVDGGSYDMSAPIKFGGGGAGGLLQVYPGKTSTYVVDGQRRIAAVTNPVSMAVRERLSLAAQPGPGQSVVDDAGRLWVVDRGGLVWFDRAGKHVRSDLGDADARLVLMAGQPVLADVARHRVGRLADDGTVRSWSCLDLRAGEPAQLLGSGVLGRVLAAVPATGVLLGSGRGGEDCGLVVEVGRQGDRFGPLVEAGGYVFVPNLSTGRTAVVDVNARQVVADLGVVTPGNRLELLAKDGLVFYNDLDGDKAGVIRFDGGHWRLGKALQKYSRSAGGATILVPAGANADDAPPPIQTPIQPPRGGSSQHPPALPGGAGSPGEPPPAGTGTPANGPPTTAPPAPPPPDAGGQTLRVTVTVAGAGRVNAAQPAPRNVPPGAVCAADSTCGWDYPANSDVLLRIPTAPTPTVALQRVTGCTSVSATAGSRLCLLRLRRASAVRAEFAPVGPGQVTLTLATQGSGTVTATPAGGAAQTCPPKCSVRVPPRSSVQLAATPANGFYLSDWGVTGCVPSQATCPVTVDADRAVTVVFAPLIDLTVTMAGGGAGSVSAAGLACTGATCTGSYPAGTVVVVTATADSMSRLGGWSGCPAASGGTCQVTLTAATSLTVTFDVDPIAPFVGTWVNSNSAAPSLTQVTLDPATATTATLHAWGSCNPSPCDWGTTTATLQGSELTAFYDQGFATRTIRIRRSGNQLIVSWHTHFTDNSGRPDYDVVDTMTQG